MNVAVPPQTRILALVGLLAVIGVAVYVVALSRRSDSASEPAPAVAAPKVEAKARPQASAPAAKRTAPARPAPAPAKPKPQPKPTVDLAVAAALKEGLPRPVAQAFAAHRVVVVGLFASDAAVDQLARTEAEAGAREAGVGFVGVDVLDDETATRALVEKLNIHAAPAVLVFTRPGTLAVRIDGFSDHETVAQAAVGAAASE
jgi:hypothetical protein